MNLSQEQQAAPARVTNSFKKLQLFALWTAGLSLLFIKPLFGLLNYALHSELYSHVPLIPCISFYLLWRKKDQLADGKLKASLAFAIVAFTFGLLALAFYWFSFRNSPAFNGNDSLTLTIFAF